MHKSTMFAVVIAITVNVPPTLFAAEHAATWPAPPAGVGAQQPASVAPTTPAEPITGAVQTPSIGLNDRTRIESLTPVRRVMARNPGSWLFPERVKGDVVAAMRDDLTLMSKGTQTTLSQAEVKEPNTIQAGREGSFGTGQSGRGRKKWLTIGLIGVGTAVAGAFVYEKKEYNLPGLVSGREVAGQSMILGGAAFGGLGFWKAFSSD